MPHPLQNTDLNYGKVLVLRASHQFSLDDIKAITRASRVQPLCDQGQKNDPLNFLANNLEHWLSAIEIDEDQKIYLIKGRKATSVQLALMGDCLIGAYILESATVKSCYNSAILIHGIELMLDEFDLLSAYHRDLVSASEKSPDYQSLNSHTQTIDTIATDYGAEALSRCKAVVRGALTNRW